MKSLRQPGPVHPEKKSGVSAYLVSPDEVKHLFHSFSLLNFLLPVFTFLVSCSAARQVPAAETTANRVAKPKILFLVFSISEDTVQKKTTLILQSKVEKEGDLKQPGRSEELFPNYLTVEYYEEDRLKSTFNLEHPLYKNLEYFDGKEMVSRFVKLEKSEFFIRLQTHSENGKIVVYETKGNSPKTKLLTTKL